MPKQGKTPQKSGESEYPAMDQWATHHDADGCNYGDLTSHRRWLLLCLLQDEGKKVNIDDWDLGTMV